MTNSLTCQELYDFLNQYVEDELPAARRAIFEHHMAICPPCKEYLASYLKTLELECAAFEEDEAPVPEGVPDDLVRAILAARKANTAD